MASIVSLPSIQEGFPDIDFREPPLPGSYPLVRAPSRGGFVPPLHASRAHPRQFYPSASPYHQQQQSYRVPPYSREAHLPRVHDAGDHLQDDLTYSPPRYSSTQQQQQHSTSRGGGSFTQPSHSHHHHHAEEDPSAANVNNAQQQQQRPNQKPTSSAAAGTHSFDVLRSEPGTVSLEHIASSKTLQNRSSNAPKPISPTGVANGSAPAFRVALPTPTTSSSSSSSERTDKMVPPRSETPDRHYGAPRNARAIIDRLSPAAAANSPVDSVESPSIVSFSMSDGSNISKLTVDDSGRSYFQEGAAGGGGGGGGGGGLFRVDGRGKKHQCPQCPKRFNRPSSLRIHVNTHTGARPFQCPYPNCGREFNVNSNMRRHYRNHSIAATAEVHPPRHNSGRRPRGYPRPHPGRSSSTVFHVSPGHSVQSATSAASMTDDDSDMERGGFDDGEGSGCDNEDEYGETDEDDEDMPNRTHDKSVTWSPSQSPSVDHGQAHLYQDSQTHIIAPPCSSSPRHPQSPITSSRIGHTYMPSSPAYARACRDPTVSTTLRPAFR